jgi:hypothetical protein
MGVKACNPLRSDSPLTKGPETGDTGRGICVLVGCLEAYTQQTLLWIFFGAHLHMAPVD